MDGQDVLEKGAKGILRTLTRTRSLAMVEKGLGCGNLDGKLRNHPCSAPAFNTTLSLRTPQPAPSSSMALFSPLYNRTHFVAMTRGL